MGETVLAVCAHPDDEAFGVGGTLARHAAVNDIVHLFFLADGVTARDRVYDLSAHVPGIEARKEMARAAAIAIGAQTPNFLGCPINAWTEAHYSTSSSD